jgi:hypothetical protein
VPTTVWGNIVFALAPTVCLGLIFWFVMRSILRADRTERKEYARIEAEERAKFAASAAAARDSAKTR